MRDESFSVFIEEFGEATQRADVPPSSVEKWRGKLPNKLLEYWETEGWCGYFNGLFWTVNPDDYEDIVDEWLAGTAIEGLDAFHVVARSAFGDLYLWGESSGSSVDISCSIHTIIAMAKDLRPKTVAELERKASSFFVFKDKGGCDLKDEDRKPLFDRALKKLGPLASDEMYGFEPAIVAGGQMRLENLRKVKLDQHLTILRQLAAPQMPFSKVEIDKLLPR